MTAFSNTVTMLPAISCVHKEGSERLDLYPQESTSPEKSLPPSRKTVASSIILQVPLQVEPGTQFPSAVNAKIPENYF